MPPRTAPQRRKLNARAALPTRSPRPTRFPGGDRHGPRAGERARPGRRTGQAQRGNRRRPLRAHAHPRSGQPLLDLHDVRPSPPLRPARRRHQRFQVRPRPRRDLAPGQQHHMALHAPQGRHLPRRHAVQRGQRGLYPPARPGQCQAHQVLRLPGHRIRGKGRRLRRRRHVEAALRLPACSSHHAGHAAGERGEERRGLLPEAHRHRPLPLRLVDARRPDRHDRESDLLEARHPQGGEGHLPLHSGAVHAHGRAAGELQVIDRVTPDLVETLKGTRGVKVLDVPAIEAQRWIFQLGKEPVKDQRLRQAISLAIDRGVIIKELLRGYGRPVDSPVPPGLIGHMTLPPKVYDPEKARQILKQAGYSNVSVDIVLMKDFYPKQLEITQAVAAMLGDVGIKLNIKNLEIASAREQRTAGTYDLFFSGWAHMPHDPDWYFGQWFTKAGSEQLTRYANPRVEQLIAEGRVPDAKVRQAKYEELERIVWDEDAELWLYYTVAIYGVSDRLRNFEARRDYYVLLSDVSIV